MNNKMYKVSLIISILSLVLNVICFFRLYNINNKKKLIDFVDTKFFILNEEVLRMNDEIFDEKFRLFIVIGFIILILLVSAVAVGLIKLPEPVETPSEPVIINIQSVNLQSEKGGKFILGLGWEADGKVYYVYKITDDGGKKLVKYSAEYVTIYDNLNNGEQPYMDITNRYDIKMYLPKGTVTEEYNVDVGKE